MLGFHHTTVILRGWTSNANDSRARTEQAASKQVSAGGQSAEK
jgi:hypothetical protein